MCLWCYMNFDEFKIIYEDIMSENGLDNLIFEATQWTLKEEIIAIWPMIQNKIDKGFSDLFGNGLPGEPEYDPTSLSANALDAGSDKPGYLVKLNIMDDYARTLIIPFYKAMQIKRSYNNPLGSYVEKLLQQKELNMYFEFYMYVKKGKEGDYDNKYDYSKSQKVEKHTISGWEGYGFVNFDLESVGGPKRNVSKLKICNIDVTLTNKQSLLSKLAEFNRKGNHVWSQQEVFSAIGGAIRKGFHKLATGRKKDKVKANFKFGSGLSNSRDVVINITWENYKLDSNETLTLDNYRDAEDNTSDIPKNAQINGSSLTKLIGKDWAKRIKFDKNRVDPQDQLRASLKDTESWAPVENGKPKYGEIVHDSDPHIVGKFEMKVSDKIYKIYEIFINTEDYKKSPNKESIYLWEKNSKKPIIRVTLKSTNNPNKSLLEYAMPIDEFENIDKKAYSYVKNVISNISSM